MRTHEFQMLVVSVLPVSPNRATLLQALRVPLGEPLHVHVSYPLIACTELGAALAVKPELFPAVP